jgi:hypothetical protein
LQPTGQTVPEAPMTKMYREIAWFVLMALLGVVYGTAMM